MIQISDEQLLEYSHEGLIPGPHEKEPDFLERVEYCKGLREEVEKSSDSSLGLKSGLPGSPEVLNEAFPVTKKLFGIEPSWIPLFYSNTNLAPWHGGCAWIFQTNDETPTAALLQLRKAFHDHKKYLGLYDRKELIAHELVHAGRMMFEEPKFEEILAYRTARSSFRRWVGPILQSANETLIFVILLVIIFALDIYLLGSGHYNLYNKFMWLKLIPLAFILLGIARLYWRQKQFYGCLGHLKEIAGESNANAIIYRLTDAEISAFAAMDLDGIKQHVEKQVSLRWRLLALYFFDNKQ